MEDIKLLGNKLIDFSDFYELFIRLFLNLVVAIIVIGLIYYKTHKKREYVFGFFLLNLLVFLICILLNSLKLKLGFALGLFAIFSILRYRTSIIPVREMTYFFIVIALGVINALAEKKISYAEILFANAVIIVITYFLEKHKLFKREIYQIITYEKIELIKPEYRKELLEDLYQRTGIEIRRIEIDEIDFLKDVAILKIYYNENQN